MPPSSADSNPELVRLSEAAEWFARDVQPHEPALRSYLRGRFPSVREVDDVVQESYLRMLRVRTVQRIRCVRGFLFTIAGRLALDCIRRRLTSPIESVGDLRELDVVEDGFDAAAAAVRHERVALLADAIAALPARCRDVLVLHKIQELSRREVAFRLGIAEKTVEVQTAKAMRRCSAYLRGQGMTGWLDDEAG